MKKQIEVKLFGLNEFGVQEINEFYKHNITNYGWEHVTKSVDILNQNEDPTFSRRELTVTEIVDAENLLQYFRGIDFSSKTAKKYKIIDNRLVPNN